MSTEEQTSTDAWGQPISHDRQGELQRYLIRWAGETDHGGREGALDGVRLTGADVHWLASQSGFDEQGERSNLQLQGANLGEAKLDKADLRGAHLEGANLVTAHRGRVSDRIRMVLLASRGYSLAQIAAIFECDEATVKRWVERYQQEGESGLQDRLGRGGRARRTRSPAALLCQAVEQTPARLGYRFGYWTTGTLVAYLAQTGRHLPERGDRSPPAAPAGLSLGSSPPHLAGRSRHGCHHVADVRPYRAGSRARLLLCVWMSATCICCQCCARCGCAAPSKWTCRAPAPTASAPSSGPWSGAPGAGCIRSPSESGRASSSPSWSTSRWPMPIVRCSWYSTTRASTTRTRSRMAGRAHAGAVALPACRQRASA